MNSVQESKQELEAAIRYAENAISSANKTIESMEFRQEMAKKQSSEQTGREEYLTKLVEELNTTVQFHVDREAEFLDQIKELDERNDGLNAQVADLNVELQRQQSLGQGYYDNMMTLKQQLEEAKTNMALMTDENETLKAEVNALEQPEQPTMPVIPKAVAIAIFREGTLFGVEAACDEIQGESINISESDYVGDFSISFERDIDLDDHIDFDWVRSKVGDYDEDNVTANLEGLCAKNNFECRIHGVDDQGDDSTSS